MKHYLTQAKNWWSAISARERRWVIIGGIGTALILGYYLIIAPLYNQVNQLIQQTQDNQQLLQWMKPRVALLQGNNTNKQKILSTDELLAVLDKNIKNSNLAKNLNEIKQSSDNGVELRFNAVAFDALLQWLAQQWQQYGIQVTQITADKENILGTADVTIVLKAT